MRSEDRVQQALAEYTRQRSLYGKTVHTRRCRRMVELFLAAEGVTAAGQITAATIRHYLAGLHGQGFAEVTIQNCKSAISTFCSYLVEQGALQANPAKLVRLRAAYRRPPVLLPPSSFRAVLRRSRRGPLHAAICLAGVCGLRLSEIMALRPSSIYPRHILIQEAQVGGNLGCPKGRRWRIVPLPPSVARVLSRLPPAGETLLPQVSAPVWCKRLARVAAGLPGFNTRPGRRAGRLFHALRAYAAMTRARAGMDPLRLMAEMGWQHWQVALRYIQIAALAEQPPALRLA